MYMIYKLYDVIVYVIDDMNITELSKFSGTSISHCLHAVKILEQKGYVTLEKNGRCVLIRITKKGTELKNALIKLKDIIKND